jgi:hypothetical protein
VAYPLGLKGVVVGEGDAYKAALADVKSAIKFHKETFKEAIMEPAHHIECKTLNEMSFKLEYGGLKNG